MLRGKQAIDDGLRTRVAEPCVTEVEVAVHALDRMLEPGRPLSARIARPWMGLERVVRPYISAPCNKLPSVA